MAITIKDVAKETGLAISTISKYMNGGTVRPQNKQVIDDAINKLGYHPAQAARGLRSARTYNVGIVLDGLENQYFALMSAEFEKRLHAAGYSFVVCCHRDDIELMEKSMEFLLTLAGVPVLNLNSVIPSFFKVSDNFTEGKTPSGPLS